MLPHPPIDAETTCGILQEIKSQTQYKTESRVPPTKTEAYDHIIHNPPSSMPNVYHTPTIFLPQDDRRRAIQASLNSRTQALNPTSSSTAAELPTAVRKPYEKRYHLTEDQIREIRALREEDPVKWSRTQLAKKFDCSNFFVGIVLDGMPASKEKQRQQQAVTAAVKSSWGVKRRTAREDRAIRKERWFRDE